MGDVFKALLIKLNPDTTVAGHSKMECVGVLAVLCVKKRERESGNSMNLGSGVKLWKWHLNNNGRVVYSNLIISIWPQKRRSGSPQNSITYGRRNPSIVIIGMQSSRIDEWGSAVGGGKY